MQLLSVNIGTVGPIRVMGRAYTSAIGKRPVSGAVSVGKLGLQGDEQANLSVHGGLRKAVYAYPMAHLAFWQAQRSARGIAPLSPELHAGFVGENLSIEGLLEDQVWLGDQLVVGGCVLRVTEPREPCEKFNAIMGYAQAAKDMMVHSLTGFYLSVEQTGDLQAGQPIDLIPGPRHTSVAQAVAYKRHKHLR